MQWTSSSVRRGAVVVACLAGASGVTHAEVCSNTGFIGAAANGCLGAFAGALTGSEGELSALSASWGGTWAFAGRSDMAGFGPFTANPQVAFNGVLGFDTPQGGSFVVGLVSGGQYSWYRLAAGSPVTQVSFDSLEGVATTPQGNPLPLDYAALYQVAVVPEPASALLLAAGLSALAASRRAARRQG